MQKIEVGTECHAHANHPDKIIFLSIAELMVELSLIMHKKSNFVGQ
jgi:hypothetical protein